MNVIRNMGWSLLLALGISACGVAPITGRRQLNLVSDQEILSSSVSQYRSFIQQASLSQNGVVNNRVMTIGQRIVNATMKYLQDNNYTDIAQQMQWELNVVDSKQVNAFCMPGGKIVVYTGLLNLIGSGTGTDDELAAVIGHEVGHAIARHASERMSNQLLLQMGGNILGGAIGNKSAMLQGIFTQAYGLGSNVFVALPFGRNQELEADRIGLVLMAMAGYNPRYAINLWQKMGSGKAEQSELFSTHPSDSRRIAEIEKYLPEALKYYQPTQTSVPTQAQPTTTKKSSRRR